MILQLIPASHTSTNLNIEAIDDRNNDVHFMRAKTVTNKTEVPRLKHFAFTNRALKHGRLH